MDLAKQFKEFGIRNSINPVPPDAQVIYYNMMQAFAAEKWPGQLLIKTQTLEVQCGMTRKRLAVSRNTLIQRGLIKYYPAKQASGSPTYEIIQLYENRVFPTETHRGTQEGTHRGTQKDGVFPTETQKQPDTIIAGATSASSSVTDLGKKELTVITHPKKAAVAALLKSLRGDLEDFIIQAEAGMLLYKLPDFDEKKNVGFVTEWARRIDPTNYKNGQAADASPTKKMVL